MAEEGEDDGDLPIVEFDAVSKNEATANAGDENDADREARRTRNRARAATEGGSMSTCDLCIASLTPNSLP
jgi:hypothetical protein